jgi:hypothetical protein
MGANWCWAGPRIVVSSGAYNNVVDGVSRTLNRLVGDLQERGFRVLVLAPHVEPPAMQHQGMLLPVPSISLPFRPEYVTVPFPLPFQFQFPFRPEYVTVPFPLPFQFSVLVGFSIALDLHRPQLTCAADWLSSQLGVAIPLRRPSCGQACTATTCMRQACTATACMRLVLCKRLQCKLVSCNRLHETACVRLASLMQTVVVPASHM